ncbi:MAG: SPOR domain-containing protein [Phycisphaerales bacterium]
MGAYRVTIRQVITVALTLSLLGGCSSSPKPGGDYIASFQQQRYAEAYDSAAAAAGRLRGSDRDQAALIAGQSAQAINRNADADQWLRPLLDNPDSAIAGRAGATLGLIAIEEAKYEQAAELLTTASKRLAGDEAARAAMYGGDALRNANQALQAREAYVRAGAMVKSDQSLKNQIQERLANTGFTNTRPGRGKFSIQVGAFSSRERAGDTATKFGRFGPVRTVAVRSKSGQSLYAVRIGVYNSKAEAEAAKKKVGGDARVVETSDE